MEDKNKIVRVYSGTELKVNLLKEELVQNGITALIQNDFNSGVVAGFSGGGPTAIDLYILESDLEKAEPIISGFIQINKG